ncbi:hypothetical protein M885DRAFT_566574 [Pelagophyceae sp. CCMP2097]|nr:hypothetical protein M885DRAFT_566574 [Pelagophyceae sp. CCMP2097]
MCTTYACEWDTATCFCGEAKPENPGLTESGYDRALCQYLTCTCARPLVVEQLTVSTRMPPVDKLCCRTACCCCHSGCHFHDCPTCFACFVKDSFCCDLLRAEKALHCVQAGGARALASSKGSCRQCACEVWDERCVFCISSDRAVQWWCIEGASLLSCHCAKCEAFTLGATRSQSCCVFQRCAFPCTEDVPCEIGCCGLMCLGKVAQIQKWEADNPDLVGYNTSIIAQNAVYVDDKAPHDAPDAPDAHLIEDRKAV